MKTQHDSETPAHGQQVITACAFIHAEFDGVVKVFLPKRAATKKFLPNVYELPGGHIEFGEDIEAGLKREIQEELHREISLGDPFAAFTYVNEVKGSHSVEVIYFAKWVGDVNVIQLNSDDHSSYSWFSKKEVIAHRNEIVPEGQVQHDQSDDPEYLSILKAFDIIESGRLNLG